MLVLSEFVNQNLGKGRTSLVSAISLKSKRTFFRELIVEALQSGAANTSGDATVDEGDTTEN